MSNLLAIYKSLLKEGKPELSVNSFVGPADFGPSRTCVQLTIEKEFFLLTSGQVRHLIQVLRETVE